MGLLRSIKTRGLLWVAVHVGLAFFDRWVEFVLYPLSILMFGLWGGIGVMMIFSLIVCWILLVFYDWVSTIDASRISSPFLQKLVVASSDALGFETLKETGYEFRDLVFKPVVITSSHTVWGKAVNVGKRFIWEPIRARVVVPIVAHAFKPALYLYASLAHDGMTCLILMRPPHYHKMGPREWALFVPSVLLSCIGWGLLVGGIIHVLQLYAPGLFRFLVQIVNIFT